MARLFGTSGIRRSDVDLTNQFCFDVGRAFAKFLKKHRQRGKVAVAMDTRKSSPRIKTALSMGLLEEGYKLVDQGIVPVPAMGYLLLSSKTFVGSCMVTGSHIRREFNGLKFFALKGEILKKHEREIEKIYEKIQGEIRFREGKAKKLKLKKSDEAEKNYEKMLLTVDDSPYPKWKVVVDCSNGCQSEIIPRVLKKLRLETIVINSSFDSKKFLARDTEIEGSVKQLQQKVKKEKADFGIAFDADGDRVVFVDEDGRFIPGDYTGTLIAKYSPSKKIVTTINTSQVVDTIGKKVIRTKVGSPYVVEMMKKHKAKFGFESNGGGISAEIMMTRDGGSTAIKIFNLLKKTRKNLKGFVDTLPWFYLYRTKAICPQELNQIILKEARKRYEGIKVKKTDGVKIWIDKSTWILFRPSSNAPEFRVFVEAKSEWLAEKLGKEGIEFVKSFI